MKAWPINPFDSVTKARGIKKVTTSLQLESSLNEKVFVEEYTFILNSNANATEVFAKLFFLIYESEHSD